MIYIGYQPVINLNIVTTMFNISNQRHNQIIITFRAINEVFWASECTKGHEPMLLAKELCYRYGE